MDKFGWMKANERKYQKAKKEVFDFLGRVCVNCGEDDIDVLQIDHIDNDGHLEREWIKGKTMRLSYGVIGAALRRGEGNLIKSKLQTLCANCNVKKGVYDRHLKKLERYNIPPF
jgi:5-methylcytosine-specific restriction endonuclease McrA